MSKTILMVDDDSDFRWTVSNVLTAAGYCVLQANNGNECIKYLENNIPDLILLDFRMPGKDGLQVANEIKKKIPAIPIIMITAYGNVKSAVDAMKCGIYDYVCKPIDNNELLFTIQRALEKLDLVQEVARLRNALGERSTLFERMGSGDSVKKLVELVEKVAPTFLSYVRKRRLAVNLHKLRLARLFYSENPDVGSFFSIPAKFVQHSVVIPVMPFGPTYYRFLQSALPMFDIHPIRF